MSEFLKKRLSELEFSELKKLYFKVFSSEEGRLVLQDLKNRSFFDTSTVEVQGIWHTDRIFFHEGIRSSILHIITMIDLTDYDNEKIDKEISDELT